VDKGILDVTSNLCRPVLTDVPDLLIQYYQLLAEDLYLKLDGLLNMKYKHNLEFVFFE